MAKLTTEEFIAKAKTGHGDKYDYSKVEYVGQKAKVCIYAKSMVSSYNPLMIIYQDMDVLNAIVKLWQGGIL